MSYSVRIGSALLLCLGLSLGFIASLSQLVWPSLVIFAQDPLTIYVDKDASGPTHDGVAWTTAYTNLQAALDQANAFSGTNYAVWVAEGVYYPDGGNDHVTNAVTESFHIESGNVRLYGGFTGTETTLTDRDWVAHLTILSGDVDRNDLNADGNSIAETSHDIQGNNAYHVTWLGPLSEQRVSAATVLDGFIITAGDAHGSDIDSRGAGTYCAAFGIDSTCSPTLHNIIFSGNSALLGGGMYNSASDFGESRPTLINVVFSGNSAVSGGGMFNDGEMIGGNSSPTLTDVTFQGNSASYAGGAMMCAGDRSNVSPVLTNVTFYSNSAQYGGALYYSARRGENSFSLRNVTFSENVATAGGALYNSPDFASGNSLDSCVMWGNRGGAIYSNGPLNLRNCIVAASRAGANCSGTPPQGVFNLEDGASCGFSPEGASLNNTDPLLAPLAYNGGPTRLHALLPGSSAIDAGACLPDVQEPINYADQRGVIRPQGTTCDIGAFESRSFTLTIGTGSFQTTVINSSFSVPLQVMVHSAADDPVGLGGEVTLIPPISGPGLSTNTPFTVTTDVSGTVSTTVVANAIAGSYLVTATARGVPAPVIFNLANALPDTSHLYLPILWSMR